MPAILRRGHGTQLDHLGFSVRDTREGVEQLQAATGATVHLGEPEPGQWYWSGVLPIAADSYIEVVGPNPDYEGDHPSIDAAKLLTEPVIFFWYVATDDIEGLAESAARVGGLIENIEWVNRDGSDPDNSGYGRAILGPGWIPQRPCIIEWVNQIPRHDVRLAPECSVVSFELFHPTAAESNAVLAQLGIDARLQPGDSRFRLVLDTPNGAVTFDNAGFDAA